MEKFPLLCCLEVAVAVCIFCFTDCYAGLIMFGPNFLVLHFLPNNYNNESYKKFCVLFRPLGIQRFSLREGCSQILPLYWLRAFLS